MLRKTLFLIALTTAMAVAAPAAVRFQDRTFQLLGMLEPDGRVESRTYDTLGFIHPSGTVEDRSLRRIGHLEASGIIIDQNGRMVGRLDGHVLYGEDGRRLATFDETDVRGPSGTVLATMSSEVEPQTAALFVLFFAKKVVQGP